MEDCSKVTVQCRQKTWSRSTWCVQRELGEEDDSGSEACGKGDTSEEVQRFREVQVLVEPYK